MDEIGDAQGGETSAAAPGSGLSAGTKSSLIENVVDFGVDVIVQEFVAAVSTDIRQFRARVLGVYGQGLFMDSL